MCTLITPSFQHVEIAPISKMRVYIHYKPYMRSNNCRHSADSVLEQLFITIIHAVYIG